MNRAKLIEQIKAKKSFLCVGLDPDLGKMPESLNGDLFAFNKKIIDATARYAVAFKPNLAFYEMQGVQGYKAFEDTVRYIQANHPDVFIIADANDVCGRRHSRQYVCRHSSHSAKSLPSRARRGCTRR